MERIQAKNPNLKLIRIGNHEREGVYSLLLEAQMGKWRDDAITQGQKFLADWSTRSGISQQELEKAVLFQELRNIALDLESRRAELNSRRQEREENFPSVDNSEAPKPQRKRQIKLESLRVELEREENSSALSELGNSKLRRKRNIPVARVEEFQGLEEEIERLEKQAKGARDEQKQKAKRLQEITRIKADELLRLSAEELEQRSKSLIDPNAPNAKILQQLISLQTEWFEQFGRSERFNAPLL